MAVSLLAPGFLFLLTAMALLIVVSVSTPVWKSVYFLELGLSSSIASSIGGTLPGSFGNGVTDQLRAGVWGYCLGSDCTKAKLGYTLPERILGTSSSANLLDTATSALVLHPIAAGLAGVALLFALCGNIITGLMASAASFVAFIVALVAFIVDLALFVTAKNKADGLSAVSASYGNALWMTLVAVILLLLASFTVCCAHHRSRQARNAGTEPAPTMTEKRRRFWRLRP